MDQIKEWTLALCACAAAASLAETLLPPGNVRKSVYFVISLMMTACLLTPISSFKTELPEIEVPETAAAADWMAGVTEKEFAERVGRLITDELKKRDITVKSVTVFTDISSDGSIVIDMARIKLDDDSENRLDEVEYIVEKKFGITADVIV